MVNLLSRIILAAFAALISLSLSTPSLTAGQRYATPPPLVISPDLSRPLMLQLRGSPSIVPRSAHKRILRKKRVRKRRDYRSRKTTLRHKRRTAALRSGVVVRKKQTRRRKAASRAFNPALLPTLVDYSGPTQARHRHCQHA